MNTDTLRKKFLNFFKSKRHKIVGSSSLIPCDDPTVLFTSAGMSQFKDQFLGRVGNFRRAASSQKCLRTDDLDKVGKTPSHHTFFEMLGNFSFGDYFKEEAIAWAWEFLTDELLISKEKLWVSVYEEDDEAYKIWKDLIKIPGNKIVKLGAKDNFWPQDAIKNGPNGPCGPCSEIFFDWGESIGCGQDCKPGCKCDKSGRRFVEVWNLVFTQFNRKDAGVLEPLPNKNIDTGMGLERIASVMQGKFTNFEIDIFAPLIKEIEHQAKTVSYKDNKEVFNIISDHIRAIVFAINDGAIPSNEDRGYVIRKLIRKSLLDAQKVNINKPFLYKLVPAVSSVMKTVYPQLDKRKEDIASVIQHEEKNFYHTLNNADKLLANAFKDTTQQTGTGAVAFNLHDTYGIPLEITKEWLKNKGINLDENEYRYYLGQQKERSKKKAKFKGEIFSSKKILDIKPTVFLGYSKPALAYARILGILKDNSLVNSIKGQDSSQLILDKTCFYPESGGQLGDQGKIFTKNAVFNVTDTKKLGDLIIHIGKLEKGSLKKFGLVNLEIDNSLRLSRRRAHTATHLLQYALRKVLGEHIRQAGSLVESDYLRFDFTHFKALDDDQLKRIEELVNDKILDDDKVLTKALSFEQAQKQGALAFFEEKYGDKVRMVCVGDYSKELCGGTHLENTSSISSFKILSESSSAKGIRRIEAITGKRNIDLQNRNEKIVKKLLATFKLSADNLLNAIDELDSKIKYLNQETKRLNIALLEQKIAQYVDEAEVVNSFKVIIKSFNNIDMDILRSLADSAKKSISKGAVIFASTRDCGLFLVIALTKDLLDSGLSAIGLVKEVSGLIGGSGGGRDDFAQAGGKEAKNIDIILEKIGQIVKQKLGA